jgi:hypothetical protein
MQAPLTHPRGLPHACQCSARGLNLAWPDGAQLRLGCRQVRLLAILNATPDGCATLEALTATYWQQRIGQPSVVTAWTGRWRQRHVIIILTRLYQQGLVARARQDQVRLTPQGEHVVRWLLDAWDGWPTYAARWLPQLSTRTGL